MIPTTGSWTVPRLHGRVRLDQLMVNLLPDQSRSQIQNWIRSGRLRVNGAEVKTGETLKAGDRITLDLPPPQSNVPFPEDIPIKVLYEDSDLAVVVKPAGIACHMGAGVRSGTLVNALLHRFGPLETGDAFRPGIVHRLDKPTSGLLVVAKNSAAHRELARQFKCRLVKKEYVALVHKVPGTLSGTIDLPLGRDPIDRKKISTRARRKRAALTRYEVERTLGSFSLLRVQIETGRTHQIRVHLSQIGHPIVGDATYGGGQFRALEQQVATSLKGRIFLHAHRLEFLHPGTGNPMRFECPLPEELAAVLNLIGEEAPRTGYRRNSGA